VALAIGPFRISQFGSPFLNLLFQAWRAPQQLLLDLPGAYFSLAAGMLEEAFKITDCQVGKHGVN